MTISIDTNVFAALWTEHHSSSAAAVKVLGELIARERLVVSGAVYGELMAGPLRDEAALDTFFADTGIEIDWAMDERMWRAAGQAYSGYARRRKRSGGGDARHILPDYLIGAHALVRGYTVLTLNSKDFKTAFPTLRIISA
jgi:predicted nucleic acid-binding protein